MRDQAHPYPTESAPGQYACYLFSFLPLTKQTAMRDQAPPAQDLWRAHQEVQEACGEYKRSAPQGLTQERTPMHGVRLLELD